MRTWPSCFETAAAPPPQHEGLLGMGGREHRTGRASRSAFTIARAGRRAKPELWLFPVFVLFRPVIDGKASRPKKRRRRAFPLFFRWLRGNTKRRVVAGRLFFPCYLQETAPRDRKSVV